MFLAFSLPSKCRINRVGLEEVIITIHNDYATLLSLNASEVVGAALRTLEREEQQYEAKLASLRAA